MPETIRSYYLEPSAIAAEAGVVSVEVSGGRARVILDATIFYPEGGGQPCDLGTIGGYRVLAVTEEGGAVVHTLEGVPEGGLGFAAGDQVHLALDAGRRRDHCQQHSGQHLLSAFLEREYDIHTVGFHLGEAYSTIDVTCPSMGAPMVADLERRAEAFIAEGRGFTIHECPPEDVSSFPFRKKLPQGAEVIRIVEIDGYDWVACCGTHVASTDELRAFIILSTERYKGNTRIYFAAGERALATLRRRFGVLQEVAARLGTSAEECPAVATVLLERASSAEGERDRLRRERAELEVELALRDRAAGGSAARRPAALAAEQPLLFSFADRGADDAAEVAKAGAGRGLSVVAISEPDRTVCVMRATPDPAATAADAAKSADLASAANLGARLKPLLQESGGRGGGGPHHFRAIFSTAREAAAFAEKVSALLA
ncbi:alanyl-tRNA editing protein [bacterium]|nr:alanyl-tRNA editing protein [bacterium]